MRIVYYLPSPYTIYANRSIYHGFKNAFVDMGHTFATYSVGDNLAALMEQEQPDIFMMQLGLYELKYLDLDIILAHKKRGMQVFVYMPYRNSPLAWRRINEVRNIKNNKKLMDFICRDNIGDIYYNSCEQWDPRMEWFNRDTWYTHHCIPFAADRIALQQPLHEERFATDIAYVGTYLAEKKKEFDTLLYPLHSKYTLWLYGQDWTYKDILLWWAQRFGQYFNIPYLRSIQKPKLTLAEEGNIYRSSKICINIHDRQQQKFGGDCNERTFKIPLCGGCQVVNNVSCINKYFVHGEEIYIARDSKDRYDIIHTLLWDDALRQRIAHAWQQRVLREHTYHHRATTLLELYKTI